MAGFEDSKIYQAAKVTYQAVSWFKSKARKLQKSAVNAYKANAIENKKMVRSAMRSVKDGLTSFKNNMVNKAEDKAYDAKVLAGKMKGRFNGLMNKLRANTQDKLDNVHYGLLVAQDKIKPVLKTTAKTFNQVAKNLQTVGKAGLNSTALAIGLTGMAAVKSYQASAKAVSNNYQSFRNGARVIMNNANTAKNKVVTGLQQYKQQAGKSLSGWLNAKKGQLKSAWTSIKTVAIKVASPMVKSFNRAAKNLQTIRKAGLNSTALAIGLTGMAAVKSYQASAKAVSNNYQSFRNGARVIMNNANTAKNKVVTGLQQYKQQAGKSLSGWLNAKKGQLKSAWTNIKTTVTKVAAPVAKEFNQVAKNLQTVGKAGLNATALAIGLTGIAAVKSYQAGAKFVGDKVAQAKNLGEKAVTNGMFMAGMVSFKVSKVAGDKVAQFKAGASKRIMGGVKFAHNVVRNIRNGGKNALGAVANTLTSARKDINNGISMAKQAVKQQARGNMTQWFKKGLQAGR